MAHGKGVSLNDSSRNGRFECMPIFSMKSSKHEERTFASPCRESPFRVALICNGHYLWCLNRNGRVGARRKRRAEKDEFQMIEIDNKENIMLINHSCGSILSVVETKNGERARCVPDGTQESTFSDSNCSIDEEQSIQEDDPEVESANRSEADDDSIIPTNPNKINSCTPDSQKWRFVRAGDGRVSLKNVKTGYFLGVDSRGKLTLDPEDSPVDTPRLWAIEAVTGELCFLSNFALDCRLRCDMSGGLGLSSNLKGWEVWRFSEAGDGFVKISSWMHNQWVLQCNSSGKVRTSKHIDSHVDTEWCSLWAVERDPGGRGVVLKSRTFGRFLCIDSTRRAMRLTTFHPFDESDSFASNTESYDSNSFVKVPLKQKSQAELLQEAMHLQNKNNNTNKKKNQRHWFRRGRQDNEEEEEELREHSTVPTNDAAETIVWQLESAHMQNYTLSTLATDKAPSKSVGQFPKMTSNPRRTDKFCLKRKFTAIPQEFTIAQLYHVEKEMYASCAADGKISLVKDSNDETTEWIMTNSPFGGTSFQSKFYNLYFSYRQDMDVDSNDEISKEADTASLSSRSTVGVFHGKNDPDEAAATGKAIVFGSATLGREESWDLAPCVPRGINSGRVRTLAIGTSLVLGSTLALPYALVSAGAVLHLGGVGLHVAVAGLSSVDAVSSVGALGVTAYLVFQPQDLSLTDVDNPKKDENDRDLEYARFKRPFSNWRNWDVSSC